MDGDRDLPAAAARLRRAADVLARQNDPAVRAVADGIMAYLAGNSPTLDIALAIQPGPGQRSAVTTLRTIERNALLRRAAEQFFPDRKLAQRAHELHRAITRYAVPGRSPAQCRAHPQNSGHELWAFVTSKPVYIEANRMEPPWRKR